MGELSTLKYAQSKDTFLFRFGKAQLTHITHLTGALTHSTESTILLISDVLSASYIKEYTSQVQRVLLSMNVHTPPRGTSSPPRPLPSAPSPTPPSASPARAGTSPVTMATDT